MDKALFSGGEELGKPEIKKCEIRNTTSDVGEKLKELGYKDKLAGCVCIGLSADNKRADTGCFTVRGVIEEKEIKIEAGKLWPAASNDTILSMKIPQAEIFRFGEGGLVSDYTPQSAMHYAYYEQQEGRNPSPILDAELEEKGIGKFCTRMICVISKKSSVKNGVILKYTVLLFPLARDKLLSDYAAARSGAWPGLRITEGELPLLPRPIDAWKCPVLPLILPGVPFNQNPDTPQSAELRRAVATIMARTVEPETARTGPALVARWQRLASNPEELTERQAAITWPKETPQLPDMGM
jgi:hypothetical protein